MTKLVKTIFDTCIAKIDEQKRTSILDKLYAESDNTRAVFLAEAEEIAKTTFEAKESLAKVFSFAEFLKQKEAPFRYSGIVWGWSIDEAYEDANEDEDTETAVKGVVFAKDKHDAFLQIEEKYMYEGEVYDGDFYFDEISIKKANTIRKVA